MDTDAHRPEPCWSDHLTTLTDLARLDLRDDGDIRPTLIAFDSDAPLFLATLRPFPKGEHTSPIIEVGALAAALGARRIALSLAGRAWSTADPVPPVLPDVGDLRQRVLVVHAVDAATSPPLATSTVWAVRAPGGRGPLLREAVTSADAEGWVPRALSVIVTVSRDAEDHDLVAQLVRCEELGHRLAWGSAAMARVEAAIERIGVELRV